MLFCREFGFVAIYALSGNILGSTLAPRKVLKIISSVVMYILSFSLRMKFSKGKAHLKRSKVDDVEIGLESTPAPPLMQSSSITYVGSQIINVFC